MKITIDSVENGWTIEVINSPARTVRIAKDKKELMLILELIIKGLPYDEPHPSS